MATTIVLTLTVITGRSKENVTATPTGCLIAVPNRVWAVVGIASIIFSVFIIIFWVRVVGVGGDWSVKATKFELLYETFIYQISRVVLLETRVIMIDRLSAGFSLELVFRNDDHVFYMCWKIHKKCMNIARSLPNAQFKCMFLKELKWYSNVIFCWFEFV